MKFNFGVSDGGAGDFKRRFFIFAGAFLVIVLVVSGVYFVWDRYFSEAGQARRFAEEQMRVIEKAEKDYVKAMTADTYGGKTPQETLDLFVAALRAEDVELASKYFMLDENLSREKWINYLQDIKNRNLLAKMAQDIKQEAKPLGSSYKGDFGFGLFNNDGTIGVQIDMQLNRYSQLWKIESL